MTVATEAGYAWTDGRNARLLHDGNRFPVKAITASADSGTTADLVDNDLTVDRWLPFANGLASPTNFAASDWTVANVTVGVDGLTLTETADSGQHDVSQDFTFTAVEHVVAFKLERQTAPEVQVRANDGTTSFTCFFDLRDLTVGTAANCTGDIVDLGGGQVLARIYFTPAAAAGVVELLLANGSEAVSYAGSTGSAVKVLSAVAHASAATLRLDTFAALGGTCFAIAAHNLWSSGARLTLEHDSNGDDTFTSLGAVVPDNDGPIMFFFDSVTSGRWGITVDRGALPEVGIVRVGDPLKFEQPFYAGFSPGRMNRATEVRGNISGTGELLGRSKRRTVLTERFEWPRLTYPWVRANLDGPGGVIQALEAKGAFIAWRPSLTDDVSFIMGANVTPPVTTGQVNLMSFAIDCEVYSYE